MSFPRVTVVIPCYNHGRFVADAVRSCLAQLDADVRVVIVDDGSDDGETPGQCDACVIGLDDRVVVLHQENRGLASARNAGANKARGLGGQWADEYLVFLDADDWIEPTFVSKLHLAMMSDVSEVRVVVGTQGGRTEQVSRVGAGAASTVVVHGPDSPPRASDGAPSVESNHRENGRSDRSGNEALDSEVTSHPPRRLSHAYCQERLVGLHQMIWAVPDWDPLLMMVTNLHPVTALVRRECFEAVGGFDETMKEGYEDWDLWLRFVGRGWSGTRVREPLFTWRRHSQTTMIVEAGMRNERLFAQLVRNHADMYRMHAPELLVLSNRLLRQSDANWLDESGEAIVLRDLRRHLDTLVTERDTARNEIGVLRQALSDDAHTARTKAEQERDALGISFAHLTSQVEALTREQVSLLATIGTVAREREEARRAGVRVSSQLQQTAAERESTQAELLVTRAQRDEAMARYAAEQTASASARADAVSARDEQTRERDACMAQLAATRAAYEAKPAMRLSRAAHRLLDKLPGPISRGIKAAARRALNVGRRSRRP